MRQSGIIRIAPSAIPLWMLTAAAIAHAAPGALSLDIARSAPATTAPSTLPADSTAGFPPPVPPLALDHPYATGNWFGARDWLEDHGVVSQFYFNDTYGWNVGGGLGHTGRNAATFDYIATIDFDRLGWIRGGRGLIHVRRQVGGGINASTGSLFQAFDDTDGDRSLEIDQLWYEQAMAVNRLWVRFGFLDYQTIIDRNAFANSEDKQFMNQALDNNPLVPINIGLGIEMTFKPCDWFSIIGGIGDASPDAFRKPGFSTAFHGKRQFVAYLEPAFHLRLPNPLGTGPLDGNYRFGMVYDPRSRVVFAPAGTDPALIERRGDDFGFYASFDQMLYRETPDSAQGLGWFFRYGFRHGDINRIEHFWSTGLEYAGLLPHRDEDRLGVAVYQSIPSREFNARVNTRADDETVFEAYYAIQIAPWLVVTPDVQYISSPGIDDSLDDCVVLGVRTRISF